MRTRRRTREEINGWNRGKGGKGGRVDIHST